MLALWKLSQRYAIQQCTYGALNAVYDMRATELLEINCHIQKTRIIYSYLPFHVARRYLVSFEVPSAQEYLMKELKSDLMHIQALFRKLSLLSEISSQVYPYFNPK